MRPSASVMAFLAFAALLPSARAVAQVGGSASVSVEVYDAADGRRLEAALVGFPELSRFNLTNAAGTAVLTDLPAGEYTLEVTVLGYGKASSTVRLGEGSLGEYQVAMNVQPFEIEGITVDGAQRWSSTLQRSGFYTRLRSGVGRLYDRESLRDRFGMASTLGQALNGRLLGMCQPGYAVGRNARGSYGFGNAVGPLPTQSMGIAGVGNPTRPAVIVDGVFWSNDLNDIPYDWVDGIEIYRSSANLPAQYAGGLTPCGVIVVWTRPPG